MADDDKTPEAQPITNPAHLEDFSAPMIYADVCMGGGPMMVGDNVTLTFGAKFLDHRFNPPQTGTKTVLRVVLPRAAALDLASFITKVFAAEQDNETPRPPANITIN